MTISTVLSLNEVISDVNRDLRSDFLLGVNCFMRNLITALSMSLVRLIASPEEEASKIDASSNPVFNSVKFCSFSNTSRGIGIQKIV